MKPVMHSTENEQSVIGGLLIENNAWDLVSTMLNESDFFHANHQLIWRAFKSLAENSVPFDVITVSDWLEKHQFLSAAGGLEYLVNAQKNTPSSANITTYAEVVKSYAIKRDLKATGEEITKLAINSQESPLELAKKAEAMIASISENGGTQGGFKPLKSVLLEAVNQIDMAFQNTTGITGVSSGFADLDQQTAGFQPADLIYIAARPSMGKTAMGLNIAASIAETLPVAVFSLEMPAPQLGMRLISSIGRIDQHKLRTGRLNDDEFIRLNLAINQLSELKLFIDDTAAIDSNYVRSKAKQLKRENNNLGAILIDYLGLMDHKASFSNHEAGIAKTSRELKAIAKELQIPVIVLAQLNREVEKRQDKRPQLSDLRGSGSIEQDGDLIMFIYRDEVYNEESPDKGTAEIIIAKQRNGAIGMVRLAFRGQFTRFENFSKGE